MKAFKKGDYVQTTKQLGCGGLGLVAEVDGANLLVQFGAGGPFAWTAAKSTRWATEGEIRLLTGQA